MTSFRKVWLPAILLMFFLSYIPVFSEYKEVIQKTTTAEISTSPEKTFFNWLNFSLNNTLKPINSTGNILWDVFSHNSGFSQKEMLESAKKASKETGIRPEFLIAIVNQESSEGKNVGSCFLLDPDIFGPGIGVDLRSGTFSFRVMKPERDIKPFFAIMDELDRNPFFTPVSCPMTIGWGGAMGYLQFIPSTWILVKDRVAIALGKEVVTPWNIEDAMMAAAYHLKDCGADHKISSSERTAACRYFSGKSCGEYKMVPVKKRHKKVVHKLVYVENHIIASYGNSIVKKTAYFQKKFWPETIIAKADTKTKHKTAHKQKKQELGKNFQKSPSSPKAMADKERKKHA